MVEVPRFTAARPSDTTAAAGQRFSFKVPAGALSKAQTTLAQAYSGFADDAARLGAVAMQLHRDDIVAKASVAMSAEIDAAATSAQQQDIANPEYENSGGGILGFFNEQISSILGRVGEYSGDPLTRRQIGAAVAPRVAAARTTVTKANTNRLIDGSRAALNEGRHANIRQAAADLPLHWAGTEATLPATVQTTIEAEEAAQKKAANLGIITAEQAGKNIHEFRGDIAEYAVDAQNNAAQTTEQVSQLIDLLDDPERFFWLRPIDRERLRANLLNKHTRLLAAELREETASRTAARAALKDRQATRLSTLLDRVFSARKGEVDDAGESVMPTQEEILYLANLDGGLGLAAGKVTMLMNMINDKGIRESDPEFVADLYEEVFAIMDNLGLSQEERKAAIAKQIDRSDRQIGKAFGSRITIQDHVAFMKWAHTLSDEEVVSGEIADNLKLVVDNVAPRNLLGFFDDSSDVFREMHARKVYFEGLALGMTPPDAATRALKTVGVTRGDDGSLSGSGIVPWYPSDLPQTFSLSPTLVATISAVGMTPQWPTEVTMPQVEDWTLEDVAKAKTWAGTNTAALGPRGFAALLEQIDAIEAYVRTK
ncbi:hypothetical protein CMI37_10120 [Candidatus Pacearchaeota archaeon]|nr:hypothetical protein [Candidatus Pacearchaeota archaeon]